MKNLTSEKCLNIVSNIPEKDMDVELVFKAIRDEMPAIAENYGLVLIMVHMVEPKYNKTGDVNIKDIELLNITKGEPVNDYVVAFEMGNGGRANFIFAIKDGEVWTTEMQQDMKVLAKLFYLLTGRARAMQTLNVLTFTDPLTGIANETALGRFMHSREVLGDFDTYCSNFINMKNMKLVNSRYGQDSGDRVLTSFAQKLSNFAGDVGCAARLGGDNFFVFIKAEREESLLNYLSKLTVDFRRPDGKEIKINIDARVGYYYSRSGDTIPDAMQNADIAARVARQSRNPDIVEFEDIMKTDMLQLKDMEENIPKALDNHDFVVYYQPKADISDKNKFKLNGAEALVRWIRDGIMVPPMKFIPILEQNGLVTLVDFYVFEQVCKDIRSWIDKGIKPIRVSSNFSRRHLKDSKFVDKIEYIIKKYDINPEYLEIEITESYDSDDMEALMRFEQRMHKLGVNLAVDDFGSGFSSLKMVKNIVSDTIKLDKSIIDGIGENSGDEIMVSHIIKMIQCLGKEVIAEGVEHEKQADFLRENGCLNIQGYLYGKPMPIDQFEEYYNK